MPCLNLPIQKVTPKDLRPKHMPRAMIGRISFEITPGHGMSLNDYQVRPQAQIKVRVPGYSDQSILATGLPEIQLKFCWPGYEHFDLVERLPLAGLKCNGQVAVAVAGVFKAMMQKAAQVVCREPRFAIAPGSPYTTHSIVLLALRHIYGDVFIAEVDYLPTSRVM
ncbi:hypothetical protein C8Q73DRAFT_175934 [Cubamyces lactineus]|nr:hypothetical protein C8Q73DRAFT_175934 [Cubamyces lactineus]